MYIGLEILCGIVITLIAFYCYLTINNNYWKNRGIPGPKPVPGFGNMKNVIFGKESVSQFLTRMYNEYKDEPMIGVFSKRTPVLIVKDVDLIKTILIKEFPKFANRGLFPIFSRDPLTHHLFNLEVERWKPLRTQFTPLFTSSKLKEMFSLILECSNHLESYMDTLIKKGKPIDMREVSARYTTDVVGSCAFGIDMNSLSEKESVFRRLGKLIFATNLRKILSIRIQDMLPWLYNSFLYVLPRDEKTRIIMKLMTETMEYREENNVFRPDFINMLLNLKKHPEKIDIELTDDLLAAQIFIFFAAGFETSSSTISNALYELALNPDIQEKLRKEIKEFEARNNGEWRYEIMKEMEYLEKVFQGAAIDFEELETLRKYPSLPFLNRKLINDYTFESNNVTVSKDLKIWIPVYGIHHDPDIYPDPEKFDPERFSKEEIMKRHPMHFLPFGHGPRNCIGARFAVYQTKIGLIKILRNFEVQVCNKTLIPYKVNPYTSLLIPITGLYLNVVKLEN